VVVKALGVMPGAAPCRGCVACPSAIVEPKHNATSVEAEIADFVNARISMIMPLFGCGRAAAKITVAWWLRPTRRSLRGSREGDARDVFEIFEKRD